MSSCIIHYDIYDGETERLNILNNDTFQRLVEAKQARLELGGVHVHTQGSRIPQTFRDNLFYHRKCYQNYTKAISRLANKHKPDELPTTSRSRRTGELAKTLFPDYCMVCKNSGSIYVYKNNSRIKQFPRCISTDTADLSIREAATLKKDESMLAAIEGVSCLHAAKFKVHDKCQKDYMMICPTKAKQQKSENESIKETDAEDEKSSFTKGDFEKLSSFIHQHILLGSQTISMKVLTDIYGFDGYDKKCRYYVKSLIIKEFAEQILFLTISAKEPQVALKTVSHSTNTFFQDIDKESTLKHAAQILREDVDRFIENENQEQRTWPPTVDSLTLSYQRYPVSLSSFFTELLKTKTHLPGERVQRHVDSLTHDVIHSVSSGNILTLKHTLLGCGLHSMTGSRITVTILSKLGNSCTYERVREIETAQAELAQELIRTQFPLPLAPKDELSKVLVHFWWDNFDSTKENKEGSIHTCHGVAYAEESDQTVERNADIQMERTKRRSLKPIDFELPKANITPHKKPPLFQNSNVVSYENTYASALTFLWKLQREMHSANQVVSYRYVGWVSSVLKKDDYPKTVITFLPVIRNPITDYSTVIECIYQSQRYAATCNMRYVHITTDAGAAFKFYQVLWNNPIEFKDVLIHLGDFHAMVEFFGIIGKIITGSGFEDVVYQADLCTTGGIKGILSGKHYNRAWFVHECLSEALHRLFIEKEAEQFPVSRDLELLVKKVHDAVTCKDLIQHPEFKTLVDKYESVRKEYLSGFKGKTAQYWMFYLSLIQLQHQFHYSINVNDFYLRLECWKKIVSLCFPTNKRNYARYGAFYVKQLENLPITHPGAVEELCEKGISVRRNDIGIGQSIDGAGEQTFMRSSKTSGGIKNFTTQAGTYEKWVMSRPFQAKFVEGLLHVTGMDDKDTRKKCLRKTEITKSEKRTMTIKNIFNETFINPFSADIDKGKLYNIASGCPTTDDVCQCLLTLEDRGREQHIDFDTRLCVSGNGLQKQSFWDKITMVEWKDFSQNDKKTKIKSSSGKTVEVAVQRDIMGFLLAKSQELDSPINIDEALKWPLSPIPLSIAHDDGEKRKTNKSAPFDHALQSTLQYIPSSGGDKVYVLDLAALMRSTVKVPETFEGLAMKIYTDIPTCYQIIYVACDTYRTVSIKSPERRLRGESSKLIIRSGKVKVPPDFQKFLCNGENKEKLFQLLEEIWSANRHLIGDRIIYFARGTRCTMIDHNGVTEIENLSTDHEEADTKIAFLIQHAMNMHAGVNEICVRSCSGDIDIPVILVGAFGLSEKNIYIDNGTGKYRKRIHVNSSTLTEKQQKALIGFHAFTGNDFVSSFLRKSKKIWSTIVKDNEEFLEIFCNLGEGPLTEDIFIKIKRFVCRMYGDKKVNSVNKLRSKMFWRKLRKNSKVTDISLLPPCASSLWKHLDRAHYIAKIWRFATQTRQNLDAFHNHGWLPDGNIDGIDSAYPENIIELFSKNKTQISATEDDYTELDLEDEDTSDIEDDI